MSITIIETLLEQTIGLSADSIGSETIAKAVYRRMSEVGLTDLKHYVERLQQSKKEWEELVESVVVPETWFFRNKASFAFLGRYVRYEWLPETKILQILSIPCSTGEEPYSIAMTLIDTGLAEDRFHIDAVDISSKALQKARTGVYGRESFRGDELSFRDRYFKPARDGYKISASIRDRVHFQMGNLMDERLLIEEKAYHIIFCRNVLIYLSPAARKRAMELIDRLLDKNGILFVGHVERPFINSAGFTWIRQPGVFACKRAFPLEKISNLATRPPGVTKLPNRSLPMREEVSVNPISALSGKERVPGTKRLTSSAEIPYKEPQPWISSETCKPREFPKADSNRQSLEKETLMEMAKQLANRGELDEAMKLCEKRLLEHALDIEAHFLIGVIAHASDDERRAEEFFNKTIYLDPNHYEALIHLAFMKEHQGDRNKAEQLRQRAQRILQREGK